MLRFLDHYILAVRTGDRTLHQENVFLLLDANYVEVLNSNCLASHVPRGSHARQQRGSDMPKRRSIPERGETSNRGVAAPPAKWCRFIRPANPLPLLVPANIHLVLGLEHLVDQDLIPHLQRVSLSTD